MSMGWLKKYKKWATELDEEFQAFKKRSAFDSNTGEWVEINKEEAIEAEMIEISDTQEEFLSEEEKNSWEEKFYSKEKEFYADRKNQFYFSNYSQDEAYLQELLLKDEENILKKSHIILRYPVLEILTFVEKFYQLSFHYLLVFLASIGLIGTMTIPVSFLLNPANEKKHFTVSNFIRYFFASSLSFLAYLSLEKLILLTLPTKYLFISKQSLKKGMQIVKVMKFGYQLVYSPALSFPYSYPMLDQRSLTQITNSAFQENVRFLPSRVEMDPEKIRDAIWLLHNNVFLPWCKNPTKEGLGFFLFFVTHFPTVFPVD